MRPAVGKGIGAQNNYNKECAAAVGKVNGTPCEVRGSASGQDGPR